MREIRNICQYYALLDIIVIKFDCKTNHGISCSRENRENITNLYGNKPFIRQIAISADELALGSHEQQTLRCINRFEISISESKRY